MCSFIIDIFDQKVRLTEERERHFKKNHPVFTETDKWNDYLKETLEKPDVVVRSKTDYLVFLYYKYFHETIVGDKFLCVVVKKSEDYFIITLYFTDKVKEGEILWEK